MLKNFFRSNIYNYWRNIDKTIFISFLLLVKMRFLFHSKNLKERELQKQILVELHESLYQRSRLISRSLIFKKQIRYYQI